MRLFQVKKKPRPCGRGEVAGGLDGSGLLGERNEPVVHDFL